MLAKTFKNFIRYFIQEMQTVSIHRTIIGYTDNSYQRLFSPEQNPPMHNSHSFFNSLGKFSQKKLFSVLKLLFKVLILNLYKFYYLIGKRFLHFTGWDLIGN